MKFFTKNTKICCKLSVFISLFNDLKVIKFVWQLKFIMYIWANNKIAFSRNNYLDTLACSKCTCLPSNSNVNLKINETFMTEIFKLQGFGY